MPPWAALGFGLSVLGALVLLFPYHTAQDWLARVSSREDPLRNAYLRALGPAQAPPAAAAGAAQSATPAQELPARVQRALAEGDYAGAARELFAAREHATSRSERRRLYARAVRTLIAGNRPLATLAAAQDQLGDLGDDAPTLELLAHVSLAADRPDLAHEYAMRAVAPAMRSAPAGHATGTAAAPEDARLRLAFDTSLGVGNLADALAVAQFAVRTDPRQLEWRRRLAQVATWSGRPDEALEQTLALARMQTGPGAPGAGARGAWRDVLRQANALGDRVHATEALEHLLDADPTDQALLAQLVAEYEYQGKVPAALQRLHRAVAAASAEQRPALLGMLADLAQRAGDEAEARAALNAALQAQPGDTQRALELARLEYRAGNVERAAQVLSAHTDVAALTDGDALRDEAQILREAGRTDQALAALRRLIALDLADWESYRDATELLERDAPAAAGQLAAQGFLRTHRPELARRTLELLSRADADAELRAFLASFDPALEQAAAADPEFLLQRAEVLVRLGDPAAAVRDARRAVALAPGDPRIRAALIWTLIAAHETGPLRAEIARWAPQFAEGRGPDASLADALVAALLALHEPEPALPYLQRRAAAGANPLSWITYADALEQSGRAEQAQRARWRAWHLLQQPAGSTVPVPEANQVAAERLALALALEGGDAARARLLAMRAQVTGRRRAGDERVAVVVSYAIEREPDTLGQAWLLDLYGRTTAAPDWVQLPVAIAQDDRPDIGTLLDAQPEWLPPAEAVQAAQRVGRFAQAQSLAFEQMQRTPDNDDLLSSFRHLSGEELGIGRPSPGASFLDLGIRTLSQQPIREIEQWLNGSVPLTQHLALGVLASQTRRSGDDPSQIVNVPGAEHSVQASLLLRGTDDNELQVDLRQRQAMESVTGLSLRWQHSVLPGASLTAQAAVHQDATDSVYLRVGGQRNFAAVTALARWSATDYAALGVERNWYLSQDGGSLGDGSQLRLDLEHEFRLAYPDFALHASAVDLRFRAQGSLDPAMAPLLPAPSRATATNAALLASNTTQFGLSAQVGYSAREERSRALRPYASVGFVHDQIVGGNPQWELGVTGSVLGTDAFTMGYRGGTAIGSGVTAPLHEWLIRYRWLF